jgi:hypothetical protein
VVAAAAAAAETGWAVLVVQGSSSFATQYQAFQPQTLMPPMT